MNHPQVCPSTTSALPGRPVRLVKYDSPVVPSNYSLGYDHSFDASVASRLLPPVPPARLYDTIARAHDHRSQAVPDLVDPSRTTPLPLIHNRRRLSLKKVMRNPPNYAFFPTYITDWCPRRSSYEVRRGAVGVKPSEVNTLVPYIPPIDTTMPPPSKEWLDAQAKRILAEAHVDFENSQPKATNEAADPGPSVNVDNDSDWVFDYDSDSTVDGGTIAPRPSVPQPSQPAPQPEPECSSHESEYNWSTDTDTDSDTESDDGYNWSTTRISEATSLALSDVPRWIIPRKRPSVDFIVSDDVAIDVGDSNDDPSSPVSSDDEQSGKRRGGGKYAPSWSIVKQPQMPADDPPGRKSITVHRISEPKEGSSSGPTAAIPPPTHPPMFSHPSAPAIAYHAVEMKDVPIPPPCTASPAIGVLEPQPNIALVLPKTPKTFPCFLAGCSQVCASAGDLQRHQQSLRHRAPSYPCLACGKSYTRSDALKRHLNSKASCKREHASKLASGMVAEQMHPEANPEAVFVVE